MKLKRNIIIALLLVLFSTSIFAKENIDVTNFVQKINIGEKTIDLPSIVYKNENYIKLRDFSFVLKNIKKDFKIIYNNKQKQISAITAYPYEAIGTELTKIDDVKKAVISSAKFDINNKQLDFNAITVKGHNYFRLRDLCSAFNIDITYNITEGVAYMKELINDTKVVEAGESLSYTNVETLNPLNDEGFISSVKDNKLKVTFCKKFNTGGYQLRCERVVYDGTDIIIRPLIISPPLHTMVTQAITYPNCTIEINIEGVKPGYGIRVEGVEQKLLTE